MGGGQTEQKIRVAFLLHGIALGGAPKSLLILLRVLNRELFELYVYTIKSSNPDLELAFKECVDHFIVYPIHTLSTNQVFHETDEEFNRKKSIDCMPFINELQDQGIDILHVNSSVFPHIVKGVKRNSGIKVITHVREWISSRGESEVFSFLRDSIFESDAVIAISDNEAESFLEHDNLHIIPNPLCFDELPELNFEKADTSLEVLMIGQFHEEKGHLWFLRALRHILDEDLVRGIRFKFTIVGVRRTVLWRRVAKRVLGIEDYGEKVLRSIQALNLSEYIELVGSSLHVYDRISNCDIVVRPSNSGDPWGRDIIEAMALKKPVVATGTSEFFVEDGITGFLVDTEKPNLLGERIAQLLMDADLRVQFGHRAYIKVRRMCDVNLVSARVQALYQSLAHPDSNEL